MATGLWTAAAGASAQATNVDVIANNLANTDTLAFKKDVPTFKEYLSTVERAQVPADIARGPIKEKELYPLDGRDQSFVVVDGTYTNFRQGALRVTQRPLDVALDGPGFLEVSTPNGIRYTRHGSLKVAMDGKLVTADGYPVLAAQPGGLAAGNVQPGQGGPVTQGGVAAGQEAGRFINMRDRGTNISIADNGEIYAGQDLVAKLSIVEFQDQNRLRKSGAQVFEVSGQGAALLAEPQRTKVMQRMLETSNVNPVEEMTNLIKANRLFEHDMKAMKTYGEMMGREANDIGKI